MYGNIGEDASNSVQQVLPSPAKSALTKTSKTTLQKRGGQRIERGSIERLNCFFIVFLLQFPCGKYVTILYHDYFLICLFVSLCFSVTDEKNLFLIGYHVKMYYKYYPTSCTGSVWA